MKKLLSTLFLAIICIYYAPINSDEPIWFTPEGDVEEIKALLTQTKGAGVDTRNSFGQTGLMYAINMGSLGDFGRSITGTETKPGLVETLIAYGADVNAKSEQSPREEDHSFANTPLHYAAIIVNPRNAVPMIDYLVRQGGDINAQNSLKETPLMWSSQTSLPENQQAIFKEMISDLADVNMQNNVGNTYLHLLIRNKDSLGVQYMMQHFGSMFDLTLKSREGMLTKDILENNGGWTPLEYAIHTLQPESEQAIAAFRPLGLNGDIKVRDEFGRNPLMLAIIRNDLPFASRQLELGANLLDTDTTKFRNFPIHFAVIRQYTVAPFVNLVLSNKADPNSKNAFGDTPLHYLVKYNIRSPERNTIAKLLIENGANPNIPNKKGETPIDLANKIDVSFAERLASLFRIGKKRKAENVPATTEAPPAKKPVAQSSPTKSQAPSPDTVPKDVRPVSPAPLTPESSNVRPLVVL